MDKTYYVNETTLLSYFAGELTAEQRKEVEEWINLSADNKKSAHDIYQLYRATDTLKYMQSVDTRAAFSKVDKHIKQVKKKNLWLVWGQRIAACLMLPLLATTLYLTLKPAPDELIVLRANPGMVAIANLPDGSKVWLNSGSTLQYSARFSGETRNVKLNGEAYFSVKKDKNKPFIVNTPFDIQTEVLGTEFNMEAYSTDSLVRTTLVSGSVKLRWLAQNDKEQSFLIKPNEEFIYNSHSKETKVTKPYIQTYTAWKDGLVIFRNTSFAEVLQILSKRFNAEFIVKEPQLYNNSFTGVFDGQHLSLLLERFKFSSGIQYKYLEPKNQSQQEEQQKVRIELY